MIPGGDWRSCCAGALFRFFVVIVVCFELDRQREDRRVRAFFFSRSLLFLPLPFCHSPLPFLSLSLTHKDVESVVRRRRRQVAQPGACFVCVCVERGRKSKKEGELFFPKSRVRKIQTFFLPHRQGSIEGQWPKAGRRAARRGSVGCRGGGPEKQ